MTPHTPGRASREPCAAGHWCCTPHLEHTHLIPLDTCPHEPHHSSYRAVEMVAAAVADRREALDQLAAERDRADRMAEMLGYFHDQHDCPQPPECPAALLLAEHDAARDGRE